MARRWLLIWAAFSAALCAGNSRRNVLFIVVDDLRPSIGAYNFSLAKTPYLDSFAAESLTFKRAYVQYAFCAPSRNSFLSGRRPDTTRVWNFVDDFRQRGVGENWLSLPGYFKQHGYLTLHSGKVFHPSVPFNNDFPKSWSEEYPFFSPDCQPPPDPLPIGPLPANETCPNSSAVGPPDGVYHCLYADPASDPTVCLANTSIDEDRSEYQLRDQKIRDSCIRQLNLAKESGANFFIACGFHKPHTPWDVPHAFAEQFADWPEIPLARFPYMPVGAPVVAWHYPADAHGFNNDFNSSCNETRARVFRRAYYAAVSYTDYNIGKILEALDSMGLANDTAVVVFGDHGWQLGEHDIWSKMTNFELGVRIPMMIRAPWLPASRGRVTDVLAEAIDLYPTLAELTGLPEPTASGEEINGTSLAPVFEDPSNVGIKMAAFSQFAKPSRADPKKIWPPPTRNETEIMGYSVRVHAWRYTAWFGFDGARVIPRADDVVAQELYAHETDDGDPDFEGANYNVVDDPAHGQVVKELHSKILGYIRLFPREMLTV